MNQTYYDKWTETAKKAQLPFQEIMELSAKTLQGFTYLKPEELSNLKKPEELVAKQIKIAATNAHYALDYWQKSFQIFANALLSAVQEAKDKTETK